jgi:hypothetical protein
MKWKAGMTPEETAALERKVKELDECYAAAGGDSDDECFDPVRDGWVDKNGRP